MAIAPDDDRLIFLIGAADDGPNRNGARPCVVR
jgi:hypothetical protein